MSDDQELAVDAEMPRVDGSGDGSGSGSCGDAATGIEGWLGVLAALVPAAGDATRIDQIRVLEEVKAGCAAAQARITAAFAASQRAAQEAARPGSHGQDEASRRGSETTPRDGASAALGVQSTPAKARRAAAERLSRRSSAAQVALARRESPTRGGRFVGLAEALVFEMPRTLAALEAGEINEWRAQIIVRETACLSRGERAAVDAELAGRFEGVGDQRLAALVKTIAYRIDPHSVTARSERAAKDRRVSLRPAPDSMAYLTALLPVGPAVSCLAALDHAADTSSGSAGSGSAGSGDPAGVLGSRAQRMADEFVRRIMGGLPAAGVSDAATCGPKAAVTRGSGAGAGPRSGTPDPVAAVRAAYDAHVAAKHHADAPGIPDQARAEPPATPSVSVVDAGPASPSGAPPHAQPSAAHALPAGVNVTVNLVVSDRTLFGGGSDPAMLPGGIPIPAPLARSMLADLPASGKAWIRRLYTRPGTGELISMDSRARTFTPAMRRMLILRDQRCRTPYCDAPARHADHVTPFARGGPTDPANGQALSEDCNYIRTAPGWAAHTESGTITVTTPTGHHYRSKPRDVLNRTPHPRRAAIDIHFPSAADRPIEWTLAG